MGWRNYIILPKYKLAISISRNSDDLEEGQRGISILDRLNEYTEQDNWEWLDKPEKDLTLKEKAMWNNLASEANNLSMIDKELILAALLDNYDDIKIVSEHILESEYMDFKRIEPKGWDK